MKTLRICKSTVSMILALIMLVSMCTVAFVNTAAAETDTVSTAAEVDTATTSASITEGTVLYLNANFWDPSSARFAAYFYNSSGNAWVDAKLLSGDVFYVTAPKGTWTNVIFGRMNPATSDNNFNDGVKWNQTGNLTYDGTKNLFTISAWNNQTSGWTAFTPTTFSEGSFIHLRPGTYWDKANAWFCAYFWDVDGNEPAVFKTAISCTDGTHYGVYAPEGNYTHMIWLRMDPAADPLTDQQYWDYDWNKTADIYAPDIDNKCCMITSSDGAYSVETTCTCEDVADKTDLVRVYFRDDRKSLEYINLYTAFDAKMFVQSGWDYYQMTETVDTLSGHTMWYADVPKSDDMIFFRTSYFFNETSVSQKPWGKWVASDRGDKTVYCVSGTASSSSGSWTTNSVLETDTSAMTTYDYGIWVDSRGEKNTAHAIKAYRTDFNSTEFNLYLPSHVDMKAVKVYTSFYDVTITGGAYTSAKKIHKNAPNTLNLSQSSTYELKATRTSGGTEQTYTLNVYHTENTASLFMNTEDDLFMNITYDSSGNYGIGTSTAWPIGSGITSDNYTAVYKDDASTKGTFAAFDEEGTEILGKNDKIKKIKGRGNSSWEASMRIFGKYAYNITFDKKVEMVEGATAAKKWSMLANNVDATMLRNTLIFSIADDIGLYYSPKTRIMDVYNNGQYMGAYIMAEKVEYGEDTVMGDLNNLDGRNEEYNAELWEDEDVMDYMEATATNTKNFGDAGTSYTYQYCTVDEEGAALGYTFETPDDYQDYNFLLEHELYDRYEAELCWFVSSRTGQAVVVKYPEVATQTEMEWIIGQYEAMESAVYADGEEDLDEIGRLIDVESFAKMYLIQELTQNLDAGATSYYIHNQIADDGTSKLVTSPVWDYDWAAGSYAKSTSYGEDKAMYDENTLSYTYVNVGDPAAQMFVKNKALKTTSSTSQAETGHKKNYNLQAKLAHNDEFWAVCQNIWTNNMVRVLYEYLDNDTKTDSGAADNDSVLLAEYMPAFTSAVEMDNARWGGIAGNDNDNWGTKDTDDYTRGSMQFNVANNLSSGTAASSYENTVYYLNDWLVTRMNYMSGTGDLYNDELRYNINSVDFEGEIVDDQLTITPTIDATLGGNALDAAAVEYTVYVDGEAVGTFSYADEAATVTVTPGSHSVYITASPVDCDTVVSQSETQRITYIAAGGVADITIYFKSSDSYRYVPSVIVGSTSYDMEKVELLGYNASYTQGYYWYKTTVPATLGGTVDLTFTNLTGMSAHISVSNVQYQGYYFGADNLNNADTAVDLTDSSETVRNFYKSATYMLTNDVTVAGLAMTSLDGTSYVLGDTDSDDTLSILDATTIQLALVEKIELDNTQSALADYDLDEETSILDVTSIQTYLVNN